MKDDGQENFARMRYFRYAVMSLTAVLVISLGFALVPPVPPPPAEPPFSEQARAEALAETMALRAAAQELSAAAADGTVEGVPDAAVDGAVTLLTLHARALLLPAAPESAEAAAPAEARAPSVPAADHGTGTATPASLPPEASGGIGNGPALTVPGFAGALAAGGRQRLADAEAADGGMARLLAAIGTAQVLAAGRLGAPATGPPAGAVPAPLPGTGGTGPATAGPAEAAQCPVPPGSPSRPAAAVLAAVEVESMAVYGYQAATTRLPPEAAGTGREFLAAHEDLAEQAKAFAVMHCGDLPLQPPGYVLDRSFLDAPAAGLARLESAALPVYGNVIALTGGTTRSWALAALQQTARRAQHWGAEADPMPGLVLDEARLPQLPG